VLPLLKVVFYLIFKLFFYQKRQLKEVLLQHHVKQQVVLVQAKRNQLEKNHPEAKLVKKLKYA
jgi:hypothetical protein